MRRLAICVLLPLLVCCKKVIRTNDGNCTSGIFDMAANGVDNTGGSDQSIRIQQIVNGLDPSTPAVLYFGPGRYRIDLGILIEAAVNTKSGIQILGAGRDSTFFETRCSRGFGIWYLNSTNSGDNFQGMQLRNFTIKDTSNSGACLDLIRLTQTASNVIENVKLMNAQGSLSADGTIQINKNIVSGTGTAFSTAMTHGVIQVNGVMAELCAVASATSATLCDNAWPTGDVPAGTRYAIAYGGRGLALDPGYSYTQYISVRDLFSWNNLFGIFSMGSTGGGNSRITVDGKAGWIGISGKRIPNSVGVWLGKHSDTFQISIPVNNTARCFVLDSAHANSFISADCENNKSVTAVTTCGTTQSCIFGYEISADAQGTGYGNAITNPYVYLTGDAFHIDNTNGAYNLSILGARGANFSNLNSYSFMGKPGCPTNLPGTVILNWDCRL